MLNYSHSNLWENLIPYVYVSKLQKKIKEKNTKIKNLRK
jgi:hypothetical protein